MKKILKLTQIMLKGSSNPFEGISQKQTKSVSLSTKAIIWVAVFFGLGSILLLFIKFMDFLLDSLIILDQAYFAVFLYLVAISVFCFVMGIIVTPAIYYFDDTIEHYLVLPISRRDYVSAKWIVNAVTGMLMVLPFSLVFTFMFVIKVPGALLKAPFIFLATLITPLIPISAVVLFIVLLFKAVPFIRNRNLYVYFTSLIGLVFGLWINFATIPMIEQGLAVETLLNGDSNSLLTIISNVIPSIGWFTDSLATNNILYFVLAIGLTAVISYLTILFTQYNYLDSALSMKESGQSGKKLSDGKISKSSRKSSAFKALMRQDFRNIMRTPILASNYFIPMVIIPVMAVFGVLNAGGELDGIGEIAFQFEVLTSVLEPLSYVGFTFFIFTMLGYFTGSFSTITSTAFSREGTNMQNLLQLPVSLKTVLNAKLCLSIIVTGILPVLLVIALEVFLKAPIHIFLVALIATIIGVICANISSIFLDVLKPKLVWSNEQEAVKQNFLSIIPMFTSFGVIGFFIFLLFQDTSNQSMIIVLFFFIALNGLVYRFLSTSGIKRLKNAIQNM